MGSLSAMMTATKKVGDAMAMLGRAAAIAVLVPALGGGADAQSLACQGGQKPSQVAELMFGRNIGARTAVSESQWARFVDREITPRFPDGLTMYNAAGQWRDRASNKVLRESSKVVHIVLPGHDDDIARLNEIAEAYKARFKQQSVGLIVRPACVAF
ncbi:MAG: DUF3574 domain-containing protein [Xanthobacteraceae bacterium]